MDRALLDAYLKPTAEELRGQLQSNSPYVNPCIRPLWFQQSRKHSRLMSGRGNHASNIILLRPPFASPLEDWPQVQDSFGSVDPHGL